MHKQPIPITTLLTYPHPNQTLTISPPYLLSIKIHILKAITLMSFPLFLLCLFRDLLIYFYVFSNYVFSAIHSLSFPLMSFTQILLCLFSKFYPCLFREYPPPAFRPPVALVFTCSPSVFAFIFLVFG